ncbi:MAG: phenylalanine--tRNA ligase beta subunit-related protein [Peptoniphilaceae bacterium]|nr:phenylalanine--tRNA ligase beta subunit-related protein [Peptoniphilaceae bacterium]MDD7543308.1 phenylalanine--tRNA ligase beta subunit-related protein [Peptoniphilaceae bacterium]MDY3075486.1 phenylalanine--tRNA ligase beta subunit-related protein [Peptoniphilaceae bacterium]MDY5765810.1 phenylalanine--tRNA ligase beta subunit-related protein [Peptoniphilaceae bacterium]
MIIRLDAGMKELGIESVVVGIAKNVDPQAKLTKRLSAKKKEWEKWAMECDLDVILQHPTTRGYMEMMQRVGRSIKKNPPTVPALIQNIRRRGAMPHVNSIVDIYNVESLHSLLAIGGHDFDKVSRYVEFTVSKKEDTFFPILSTPKHVAPTDYLYRDAKGIMAWMGVRDGENYKFDENTKNAIFIIQGNEYTSERMRLEALARIEKDLTECMPGLEFITAVADVEHGELVIPV